jgi:hypothetical protein
MEEKEVKLSDRLTVTVRSLDGYESMIADEYLGGSKSQIRMLKTYAVAQIRKFNDEVVAPLGGEANFKALAKRLTLQELDALLEDMLPISSAAAAAEDELKNGLTAQ